MVLRFSIPWREISVAYNKVFILWSSPGVLNTITSQTGQASQGDHKPEIFLSQQPHIRLLHHPRHQTGPGCWQVKTITMFVITNHHNHSHQQSEFMNFVLMACLPRDDLLALESSQCFVSVKLGNQFHAIFQFLWTNSHQVSPELFLPVGDEF